MSKMTSTSDVSIVPIVHVPNDNTFANDTYGAKQEAWIKIEIEKRGGIYSTAKYHAIDDDPYGTICAFNTIGENRESLVILRYD